MNVQQIMCKEAPCFEALLRAFFAGHHSMEGRHWKRLRRWSLGPSKDVAFLSADTLSEWLIDACNVIQCPPIFKLDVAHPPQSRCFHCQRHWCTHDGHPLRRRVVHQLRCHGSEVHRHRDTPDSGSSPILWLPVQGRPTRKLLSYSVDHARRRARSQSRKSCPPVADHQTNGICGKASEVCSSAQKTDNSGSFPDAYAVRTEYVRTPVCDHSFPWTCLFIS